MNNILEPSAYSCSGCGACDAICPVKAIHLKRDDYGFYVAHVDESICISCGRCKSVCTRYDEEVKGNDLYTASLYALKSSYKETVKNCSSGGIASVLSEYAIENGYEAVGAVYDLDNNLVRHEIISSSEELKKLAGSKYLQSNTGCFRDIKNKAFIFGTPCQIAGMHKLLTENYKRNDYVLIEVFCHGVPSYKLWDEELKKIKNKLKSETFDSLQFRYKKDDWHMYCIKAQKGNNIFYGEREKETFWQVYFENMFLSNACYDCRFRKEKSYADIRLGDYWGKKFSNDSEGVSAVFCLTENGNRIIHELIEQNKAVELEKTSNEEMLRYQNMKGYDNQQLHKETLEQLRTNNDVNKVIQYYRKRLPVKQRVKHVLLNFSGLIPGKIRYQLRKVR